MLALRTKQVMEEKYDLCDIPILKVNIPRLQILDVFLPAAFSCLRCHYVASSHSSRRRPEMNSCWFVWGHMSDIFILTRNITEKKPVCFASVCVCIHRWRYASMCALPLRIGVCVCVFSKKARRGPSRLKHCHSSPDWQFKSSSLESRWVYGKEKQCGWPRTCNLPI